MQFHLLHHLTQTVKAFEKKTIKKPFQAKEISHFTRLYCESIYRMYPS